MIKDVCSLLKGVCLSTLLTLADGRILAIPITHH